MSEQTRKLKNPLLTAAGQGFPFEGYSTNPLLMPVTPATPAILQDASPAESLVVNESTVGISSQQGTSGEIDFSIVQDQGKIPETSDPTRKEQIDQQQPPRQSYFTSILSSLPNLSLSTIKGDTSASQAINNSQQKSSTTNPGVSRDSSNYGFSKNQYGPTTTSGPFLANDPSSNNTGQYSQGYGEIGFPGQPPTSAPPRPPPTVSALPPSGGPGSYRLGNQRRLKYAPPPDLTSNNPRQYQTPGAPSFFTPVQQSIPSASDFFVPNVSSLTSSQSSPGPLSTSNLQTSVATVLHGSKSLSSEFPATSDSANQQTLSNSSSTNFTTFSQNRQPSSSHYDPGALNWSLGKEISSSSPREIPSRFPETATPQNTPANASFVTFATSYSNDQPEISLSGERKDFRVSTINAGQTKFPDRLNFDVPISAYAGNNVPPTSGCVVEPNVIKAPIDLTQKIAGTIEDNSFTPISAAKVTAKLENFLAEREEDSSSIVSNIEPEEQRVTKKSQEREDLAEIDLTANDSLSDLSRTVGNFDGSQISNVLDLPPALGNETFVRTGSHLSTPAETNVSSKSSSVADFSLQRTDQPSVTNFFNTASAPVKSEYFGPTNESSENFYDPRNFVQSQRGSFLPPDTRKSDASSSFLTADTNFSEVSSAIAPSSIPTFYNPEKFSTTRDSTIPILSPPIPSASSATTQSPFDGVLGSSPPNIPIGDSFMASAMPEPTGSATLNPVQMSVNPGIGRSSTDTVPPSLQSLAAGPADRRMQYRPVYHHWFYRKEVENKVLWLPFSMQDSLNLEDIHNSTEITPETTVATDGGRYDVVILRRSRTPVYWSGNSTEVRRSSWFYKGSTESRYVPYEESTSARLEEEYKQACMTDNWNRRVELNNGEYIVFHSSTVQVHHMAVTSPELVTSWGNATDSETGTYLQGATSRPKVVKRGVDEFNIDEGEPEKVDHLLFLVHGVGSACDLKFRTVEEVVDEFRSISLQLVQSHYRTASMHGVVNRIEVLPISWHTTLHSEDTGIDKKLRAITLESIPKLRHFTNDTLLDILFYTSPIYCQTIMQTVGNEMNRLYSLFKERNSNFAGSVYLGGHSLGSLILFDLLCHQKPPAEEPRDETDPTLPNTDSKSDDDTVDSLKSMKAPILKRRLSKKISYVMGAAGTGQPFINYPQLSFLPQAFFALGSPIGMFVTVRGIDTLGEDFALPTCPAFFNVFHPFDPVAYRVESLINPEAQKYRPMLIPHHKGRKRMHLELKETMARVGADLKQRVLDSVRSTWNSVYQLAMFHRPDNQSLEQEIEKVVEEQLHKSPSVDEHQNDDDGGGDFKIGQLNGGRRIDYVLQEAPFEYINEYIFALTSHVCYWESEDTMLMILKEIYGTHGVQADAQLPPQTMTVERVTPSPSIATISGVSTPSQNISGATSPMGFDPTSPITTKVVGPPPISGFVRKS